MKIANKIKKIFNKPNIVTVDSKEYIIDDSLDVKIQHTSADIKPYGWAIESRTNYNGNWTEWYNHWNHRIYNSKDSAMGAYLKMYKSQNWEYRIIPLYRLDKEYERQCKIERIFSEKEEPKKYELKAWKLKEEYEWYNYQNNSVTFPKNTVFIQLENGNIIKKSNSIDPTSQIDRGKLKKMIDGGLVDEVELKDEKWLYPHLLKVVKEKIK